MTPQSHLKTAKMIAKLLDNQFKVGGIRFGLDPIVNLIPGLGDVLGMLFSLYLVWIALQMEIPKSKIYRMLWHIFVDFLIGIVPIVGTVGDIFYRANAKNLRLIESVSSL